MFNKAINQYLNKHHYKSISLQSVLFDMDGVLFNSMPYHADAWYKAMNTRGLNMTKEEAYLHEGRTGSGTINIVYQRQWNRQATKEEIEAIYNEKTIEFNKHPLAKAMPGAWEILCKVKKANMTPTVVTGSGQSSLLNRLEENFPGMFRPELMVTAFDVKFGKPHPEPYLMALEKGKLQKNEAIVIENAPLGVEAGVAAGIFTIAVNTGPLDPQVLLNSGANLLFPSIQDLCNAWDELITAFKATPKI
ncbi:HAD-IA family hydrolase [uncultured Bacteroides sp.]|uniref:HAD-IA family hydrolase n=1 Tax=uncultured Bacteroides sp. TaxID=162156 RepID=UPI002AABBBCA|nr:HAD-IA family hydrolase [uncultured Bacteroides sp.]